MRYVERIVSASIVAGVVQISCAAVAESERISLSSNALFQVGNSSDWSSSTFDDSAWQTVLLTGSWQSQGITTHHGWYRIHFDTPADLSINDPAIALGVVLTADEVYLNGRMIGGEGRVNEPATFVPWLERVYRFPSELLKTGEFNVVGSKNSAERQVWLSTAVASARISRSQRLDSTHRGSEPG